MPQNIYTVEVDGHDYEIEGDRPPTEAEARAAIQAFQSEQSHTTRPTEAERQANMAKQAGINTDPDVAFADSLMDTAGRTVRGAVRGAASILDPRTYIETARTVADAMNTPMDAGARSRTLDRAKAFAGMVRNVASGDPDAGGEMIGQLASGLAVPRIAPKMPNAMVRTGEVMESVGQSPLARRAATVGGTVMGIEHGAPEGVALALTPQAVELGGRALQRGGKALGGTGRTPAIMQGPMAPRLIRTPAPTAADSMSSMLDDLRTAPAEDVTRSVELQPSPTLTPEGRPSITPDQQSAMSVNPHMKQPGTFTGKPKSAYAPSPQPVVPSPNAGGRLMSGQPRISTEDALASAVSDANTPAREPVNVEPPPVDSLSRIGRSLTGEEIEGLQRKPVESAPNSLDVDIAKSELQRQLEASLDAAGLKSTRELPKSKSSGFQGRGSEPSATSGLTRNDVEALGLDPDQPLTHMTADMMEKLLQARQARRSTYAERARSATRMDAALESDE